MRTFAEENQYFLLKFHSEVKGFTLYDRLTNYNRKLKNESRQRLREYYGKLESEFQKMKFYSEIIDLFREFEFEFLVFSIYFDEDAEYILKHLSPKLQLPVPNFIDKYSLLALIKELSINQFSISSFHLKYFHQNLALNLPIVPSKNSSLNPEAVPISKWLAAEIQKDDCEAEIIETLLHFHKYWQLHFCEPFNYTKAIVILEKVNGTLGQIQPELLKINLLKVLDDVRMQLQRMLPTTIPSPFTDLVDVAKTRDPIAKNGYLLKLEKFKNICDKAALYFRDSATMGLIEVVEHFCSSTEEFKSFLLPNILSRFKRGVLPTMEEIAWIRSIRQSPMIIDNGMNLELHQQIAKHNYIF